MNYKAEFNGWNNLRLGDLIVAYRKAKADCFNEGGFPSSAKFSAFEENLLPNLEQLLKDLNEMTPTNTTFIRKLSGETRLVPKKLKSTNKADAETGHAHFSESSRAVAQFFEDLDVTPEFRIVGDFPVEAHIFSALWINMIGHKFDARLNSDIYGARVRRIHSEDENKSNKPFHISAIDSFQPYYQPYKNWRQDGLNAIRTELENERDVVAVSLDLKAYYHTIDPSFITETKFIENIGFCDESALSEPELLFNKAIVLLLRTWSKKASSFANHLQSKDKKEVGGGLVIGLTASRIISNVLLWQWDKLVKEELTPIHYGRYVDDMFLVLADGGKITSTKTLMEFLSSRLKYQSGKKTLPVLKKENDDLWTINFPKSLIGKSVISLQSSKQKLFILSGQSGADLVDSIEQEINKLSSEHRLLPSPEHLSTTTAARVLSATSSTSDSADTFRKADGMSIHRLSWAIQLRQIETIARDLPKFEWKDERHDFYRFAHDYIIRADKIFDQFTYLPRLLSIAISIEDWEEAYKIVDKTYDALDTLSKLAEANGVTINGSANCSSSDLIWSKLKATAAFQFIDAASSSFPIKDSNFQPSNKLKLLGQKLIERIFDSIDIREDSLNDIFSPFIDEGFYSLAPKLQCSDLAKNAYKSIDSTKADSLLIEVDSDVFSQQVLIFKTLKKEGYVKNDLIRFVLKSQEVRYGKRPKRLRENIYPFLFPTRPYNAAEILNVEPYFSGKASSLRGLKKWAKYVKAVRGTWVKPSLLTAVTSANISNKHSLVNIGNKRKNKIKIAVTSIKTSIDSWSASAVNKPNLSLERYKQLCHLVNAILGSYPKPDYVLLPELSLPLKWVNSVTNRLSQSGIGLVAGTEYKHISESILHSEALLNLSDDRLGYPIWCRYTQPKILPAVAEDKDLQVIHGKKWKAFSKADSQKPIYSHDGFNFGVMVCSELQNSKDRIAFQGNVDALFILSWNQDLETFSALLEATALDVHAYSVLVNNRSYGDSRVRTPAKEHFKRDLARIKGGENDYFVTVSLNLRSLREFQSRALRWTTETDKFKPVPEGFEILESRRVKPAK